MRTLLTKTGNGRLRAALRHRPFIVPGNGAGLKTAIDNYAPCPVAVTVAVKDDNGRVKRPLRRRLSSLLMDDNGQSRNVLCRRLLSLINDNGRVKRPLRRRLPVVRMTIQTAQVR
ncbi:MAG: hypothetical protein MPL62_06560 [Alphaproteobacteria bacterium]|nr:hypothetical protein [Alphaproteobacteria bacterium]